MINAVRLVIGTLSLLWITCESIGQQSNYEQKYPLELVLRNDSTINSGLIMSANDTSLTFLPLSPSGRKYVRSDFKLDMNSQYQILYKNINFINTVHYKRNSNKTIRNTTLKSMLIGSLLGVTTGLLLASLESKESSQNSLVVFSKKEVYKIATILGGLTGLAAGITTGVIINLSTKQKVYQKIEFPLAPNAVESQREMVSKLIYKE